MDTNRSLETLFPTLEEIPEEMRISTAIEQREYLMNGVLEVWNGKTEEILSPIVARDGDGFGPVRLGSVPELDAATALKVLDAASAAWDGGRGVWPTMSVHERICCMEHFVYRMAEKRNAVVKLLMWEICKTRPDAEKEFDRTIDYIKDTIDALKDLDRQSSRFAVDSGIIAQVRRAPLGVVLCMGPFNYPLNETFTTLIPALIMGNTVVFKPARYGVLLLQPLLEAFQESFPPGVINTIYGDGKAVVGPLMQSGKVDCLAFIGSTRVADILKHQHPAPHRLRCVLGLAAKNPAIILPDADLGLAVEESILGALSFNGQRCTALKLIFVHESIAPKYLELLCEKVSALPLGMPWDKGAKISPLAEPGKADYMLSYIKDAEANGAKVLNPGGGTAVQSLMIPAVVYPVNPSMRLYHDEQFGPIVAVTSYRDIDDLIRYTQQSQYGQQASIFGSDPDTVAKLIDMLANQVCRINLNSQCQRGPDSLPFTGRKDSAEGTLSVTDALRVFTIRTLVAAKGSDPNKTLINDITHHHRSKFLTDDFIL